MSATLSAQLQQRLVQQLSQPAPLSYTPAYRSNGYSDDLRSSAVTGVKVVSCSGRSYPVKTVYLGAFGES